MIGNINDLGSSLKNFYKNMPLFVMFVLYFTIILCIFSLFLPLEISYLVLISYTFINDNKYWTIFTFTFYHTSILNLVFALFFYLPNASSTEKKLGTVRYIYFFIINSGIIGVVYGLLMFCISFISIFSSSIYVPCIGLWPVIMMEVVINCNVNPNDLIGLWCFFCQIPNKWYPWVLVLMFSVMNSFVFYDLVVGLLVGYFRKFYLDVWKIMNFTYLSSFFVNNIEKWFCGCLVNYSRFVRNQTRDVEIVENGRIIGPLIQRPLVSGFVERGYI